MKDTRKKYKIDGYLVLVIILLICWVILYMMGITKNVIPIFSIV